MTGKSLGNADKIAANRDLRDRAVYGFREMMHSATPAEFAKRWAAYRAAFADQPDWLRYMESAWRGPEKVVRWVRAWLDGTAHYRIETNNYVESWHNQLKRNYLRFFRRQRVDVLVHVLIDRVVPDFRHCGLRVRLACEQARLSKTELDSRDRADLITSADMDDMVGDAESPSGGSLVRSIIPARSTI